MRYEYAVITLYGPRDRAKLNVLLDEGYEPFAVTTVGRSIERVHLRRGIAL